MLAHLLKRGTCKLVVSVHGVEVSVKAGLKSETVHYIELTPHDDTSSLQLGLFEAEAT